MLVQMRGNYVNPVLSTTTELVKKQSHGEMKKQIQTIMPIAHHLTGTNAICIQTIVSISTSLLDSSTRCSL